MTTPINDTNPKKRYRCVFCKTVFWARSVDTLIKHERICPFKAIARNNREKEINDRALDLAYVRNPK